MVYVKRIITALLFLAGLAGLLVLTSFLFMPKNNNAEFGIEEASANGILGEKSNTIDVLFIGDSESYSAFIPMQLWKEKGYTSYVCGTSGQTLDYTQTMLKRSFEKQKPKIVILETLTLFRKQKHSDYFYTKVCERFAVFRYHDRWKHLKLRDFSGTAEFTWTDEYKGYRYSNKIDPCKKTEYMHPTEKAEEISDINRRCLKEIKALCDENGTRLILVSTPSPVNWTMLRHNGTARIAAETGCEYIDLNCMTNEVPIDWNLDTRDKGDHLNLRGAEKVTSFIADYLNGTGLLTSHTGDKSYAEWDEISNKFETIVSDFQQKTLTADKKL